MTSTADKCHSNVSTVKLSELRLIQFQSKEYFVCLSRLEYCPPGCHNIM